MTYFRLLFPFSLIVPPPPFFFLACGQESELERLTRAREAELSYNKEQNALEVAMQREMAGIETQKFKNMVESIGAETIQAIATAGPEMQVKLLQSLGLKSTLITDGSSPINLFNTAHGLVGGHGAIQAAPEQ